MSEYRGTPPQIDNPALAAWSAQALRPVLLPSGSWVRVRLPSVEHLLRKGAFPHDLEAMAVRFTMETITLRNLSEEERATFLRVKDVLICWSVRQRLVAGEDPDDPAAEWADVDLSPYVLDLEQVLPAPDLDALGFVAIRMRAPEAVTADSRMRLTLGGSIGTLLQKEGRADAEPAAGDFRGLDPLKRGDAAGASGGDVRLPAVDGNGDHEPGRRAAGRSGARAARADRAAASKPTDDR